MLAVKAKPVSVPSCVSSLLWPALQPGNVAAAFLTSWSAASKNDPFDGNALGRFPRWIHDGALPGWGAEPGVGHRASDSNPQQMLQGNPWHFFSTDPSAGGLEALLWVLHTPLHVCFMSRETEPLPPATTVRKPIELSPVVSSQVGAEG
ncbi:hypothetical protein IHE44_0004698 [Lamprotornis superbus]|uniref:Uncharacterized protein n=1 Tax=Lamprotornis superbus TaxID=245042 RepID=A0A835TZH8_9PASS|nr:hypothetical protein IHE44_0004698 [Lamprotornis superbus]